MMKLCLLGGDPPQSRVLQLGCVATCRRSYWPELRLGPQERCTRRGESGGNGSSGTLRHASRRWALFDAALPKLSCRTVCLYATQWHKVFASLLTLVPAPLSVCVCVCLTLLSPAATAVNGGGTAPVLGKSRSVRRAGEDGDGNDQRSKSIQVDSCINLHTIQTLKTARKCDQNAS